MKEQICTRCGSAIPTDEETYHQDDVLCPSCAECYTDICSHCGERFWNHHNVGTNNFPLCQDCYDAHYHTCDDCGAILHHDDCCYIDDDDDTPYCSHCVDEHRISCSIQSYYYRPEPVFHGVGKRFFGVELEIDNGGELNSVADALYQIGNQTGNNIYIKHDGSLDDGMEIVTHPMTLDFHKEKMPWEELCKEALQSGYYSHQAETCGLHVHVNRNSFGDTQVLQELAIARVLYFVETHWNELLRFSRRTQRQLNKWAARSGRKDSPKEVMDCAKHNGAGRYTCVNLTNYSTIEFRIFRGTLKVNTILATLELVHIICDLAISMSDEEFQAMTWTGFVAAIPTDVYPELVQYLKERRLYVSEPVNVEVEL